MQETRGARSLTLDEPGARSALLRRPLPLGLLLASVVVVLDQASKLLVVRALDRGRFVPWLTDDIGWQLTFNDGAAFSIPAPSWLFLVVVVIVVVVIVRALPRVRDPAVLVAYALLLAGAVGNGIDRVARPGDPGDPRFLHGHVVDFVAWGAFPRFNVADAAITIGFVFLVIGMIREERADAESTDAANVDDVTGADDTGEAASERRSADLAPGDRRGDAA